MKLLSILVLVMSCFASYGSTWKRLKVPKTVEEAKQLLRSVEADLAKAEENLEKIRKANSEKFEKGLLPGGKKNALEFTEEEREEYDRIAGELNWKHGDASKEVFELENFVKFRQEELQAFETDGNLENLNKKREALMSRLRRALEQFEGISPETFRSYNDSVDSRREEVTEKDRKKIIQNLNDKIIRRHRYTRRQIQFAIEEVEDILDNIEEKDRNTEAKGANRCATCDDEHSPSHTAQVERGENTNPEATEESRVKKGARGGDSGSR